MKRQLIKNCIYQITLTRIPQYYNFSLHSSIKRVRITTVINFKVQSFDVKNIEKLSLTLLKTRLNAIHKPLTKIHM